MKKAAYMLYGIFFHILRLFPLRRQKVVFLMIHNSRFRGNFRYIYEEMKKRGSFTFVVLSKEQLFSVSGNGIVRAARLFWAAVRFCLVWNYHLATAEYVFLNDNFLPLAYMNFSPKARLVQLWHGVGAWKRFGLTSEQDEAVRALVRRGNQRLTHLFVSSEKVAPFYADAFGVRREIIHASGVPVTDFYFDEKEMARARERALSAFPGLAGKKVLLYTPTFRADAERDGQILERFPAEKILRELGEDWAVLFRFHPKIHPSDRIHAERCYDATDYDDVKDLYVAADVLVNDYSSTIVEFSLLRKPVYQYAYDYERYERGFYLDYWADAPGPTARGWKELADRIKDGELDEARWKRFISLQYDRLDGHAAGRVVDVLLEGK